MINQILQFIEDQMDIFLGIGSFVFDVMDTEGQLKKLLQKLEVLIFKADKLFTSTIWNEEQDQKERIYYEKNITEARQFYSQIQNKTKALGIKHKITMNLPFDKTKNNLKQQIEQMQKMIEQLKEIQNSGISKRKINSQESKIQPQIREIVFQPPTLIEDDMGPTIQDKQDDRKGVWIRVNLKFGVQQKIREQFRQKLINQQLYDIERTFQMKESQQIIQIFNRQKFKPNYQKLKKIIPQIDFITSKDKHFQIVCKRSPKKISEEIQDILMSAIQNSSQKDHNKSNNVPGGSQQTQKDVFFSFPIHHIQQQNKNQEEYQYKIFCNNYSKAGTFVLRRNSKKWEKFTQTIQIQQGYQLCPILKKPERILPIFTYLVNFEILKFK